MVRLQMVQNEAACFTAGARMVLKWQLGIESRVRPHHACVVSASLVFCLSVDSVQAGDDCVKMS